MHKEARDQAIDRLIESAIDKGADAVVMLRFDSGSLGEDMHSVVAYGTAVKYISGKKN